MSVEFEQNNDFQKGFSRGPSNFRGSLMSLFLIKKGIAKDTKQANIVLLGITILAVFLTMIIFYKFVFSDSSNTSDISKSKEVKVYLDQGLRGKEFFEKIRQP